MHPPFQNQTPKASPVGGVVAALLGIIAVAVAASFGVRIYMSPAGPQIAMMPQAIAVPVDAPPTPTVDEQQAMQAARAAYLRDRDLVRNAKPSTEDAVTKIIGRPPDNVLELPQMTMVQWYYDDKPVGRDVLQITVQGGKITMMSL
jgi:hypothetical protein